MAIIYKATNKVTGKSYIGQTRQSLESRKNQHITKANRGITGNYKFPNALRKYPENTWEWSVVEEVDINSLDVEEAKAMLRYNTVENGYNTILSGNSKRKPCYDTTETFHLFHPVFGFVSATRGQLRELDPKVLKYLTQIVIGIKNSYYGWRKA
jgi:hypothetical protein